MGGLLQNIREDGVAFYRSGRAVAFSDKHFDVNALAGGIVRWITEFITIAAVFAILPTHFATLAAIVIFLTSLTAATAVIAVEAMKRDSEQTLWFYTLTNRFFYKLLLERVRGGASVDTDELFKEATILARDDIKQHQKDQETLWSLGGSTVIGSILFNIVGILALYATAYGTAAYVGTLFRSQ